MNLPLDFDSTEPWQKIVKIGLAVAAIYGLVVVGAVVQGHLLGGGLPLLFGLAFYALLRRANRVSMGAKGRLTSDSVTVHPVRVWGFSLNVPSGEFSLERFSAVGLAQYIVVDRPASIPKDTGIVQLVGRPGTPNIEVMIDDIDTARPFADDLSRALNLELTAVAVPGQTIRRYTV
ncbi:MAG TPA: hypothetical protein VN803_05730 [Gemmatimonadales bacterium]|nr:hypothetical protein [Gemmatimonadales bacterium]